MNYIGIPTINCEPELRHTLMSMGTVHPHKLLILNNGEPFSEKFKKENFHPEDTIVENNENIGISKSWNYIMKWALRSPFNDGTPDNVFILNDDIELNHNTIDIMTEMMNNRGYGITSAYMAKRLDQPTPEPRYVGGMHFSCFAITKDTIEKVGYFDEKFTPFHVEDTDYYYRAKLAGIKMGTDREAKFLHFKIRPRGDAVRWEDKTVREIHQRNRAYFFKKHGVHPKAIYRESVAGSRR
jgi:GT2 family glycosyltransferase